MSSAAWGVFAIGTLGLGAYVVTGASSDTKVYPTPVATAYAALEAAPSVPPGTDDLIGVAGSQVSVTTSSVPDSAFTWHFALKGHEFGRYTAQLTPKDATSTKVSFQFQDVDPAVGNDEVLRMADFPTLRGIVRKVTYELATASIEGRPADRQKIQQAQSAIVTSPKAMSGAVEASLDEAIKRNGWDKKKERHSIPLQ